MKINNFKKIIREAVREELRASLPELLKETYGMKPKKPATKKSDFMTGISHAMELQKEMKVSRVPDSKKYSTKMSLQEALADTSKSGQHIPQDASYPIMDKMFTTGNVPMTTTSPDGRPINLDNVSDTVIDNLTKDYSQLLKKVDEKSSAKRR